MIEEALRTCTHLAPTPEECLAVYRSLSTVAFQSLLSRNFSGLCTRAGTRTRTAVNDVLEMVMRTLSCIVDLRVVSFTANVAVTKEFPGSSKSGNND